MRIQNRMSTRTLTLSTNQMCRREDLPVTVAGPQDETRHRYGAMGVLDRCQVRARLIGTLSDWPRLRHTAPVPKSN